MSEPVQKKQKLEEREKSPSLSDPNEPLTQRDVIYFQKEALFRCFSEKRNQVNVVQEKFDTLKTDYLEVSMKLSNIIALIITLAKFLEAIINGQQDIIGAEKDDDLSILVKISEGDEEKIIQLSDSFMKILMKYFGTDKLQKADSIDLEHLSTSMKSLQKEKKSLSIENSNLLKELEQLKKYYETTFKKYERNESLSIQRVYGKEIEGETKSSGEVESKQETVEHKQEPVKDEASFKNNTTAAEVDSTTIQAHDDNSKFQEYEDKIIDLKNNIESLETIIKNLETSNKTNHDNITRLETELLATNDRNKEIITTQDTYLNKIESLTKENNELNKINDSFLNKFQTLTKEREIFSNKLTESFKNNLDNLLKVNSNLEKDLVRIRTARDDLLSKIAILESQTRKSELIEDITKSLKLSNEQWSKFTNNNNNIPSSGSVGSVSPGEEVLIKEIKDMEIAFKSLTELNNKKYSDLLNSESVISKLAIEKTKADQKYFAAMRSKDSILIENKNLLKTVSKSNEFITQLKDSEKILQGKIKSLQEQLQLVEANGKSLMNTNKMETRKFNELNSTILKLNKMITYYQEENDKHITKLNGLTMERDSIIRDKATVELENKQKTDIIIRLQERLKTKGLNSDVDETKDSSHMDKDELKDELENFRTLVYCSLCSKNWKSTAIKTCGHVFCDDCVKERLAARMRKCPTCNHPFASPDLVTIHL
ncbi:E3 ubiquitin-protein ligase Bre1p [Monosporozyma servazzii]